MPGMSSFQGPVPSILHGHTCKICTSLEFTVMVTVVMLQQLTLVIGSAFKVGLLLLPYASSFTEVCVVWAYQLKIDTISTRKYILPFCTLFGATGICLNIQSVLCICSHGSSQCLRWRSMITTTAVNDSQQLRWMCATGNQHINKKGICCSSYESHAKVLQAFSTF